MSLPKNVFFSVLVLEVFVHFSGIAIPFFSNDPALYAAISKTMVQRHDFTDLYVYGIDWLDKPHFPFWMAAVSFKLFGISEWSYRLPALLFILLGAFYTFRLAEKLYDTQLAQIAVLVLLAAQHLLMSDADVRAEPYLLALIVGAVYHFYRLFERVSPADLILGSLCAGCAVMTKGLFALVPIAGAIGGHALLSRRFAELLRWRWLLALLLTAFFLLPEVYAVYIQFDRHPEKTVFGKTGVSGVKWFLWDSQFSRFVNNGPITRPKGDVFYYVHTLLWAYAPWCLLLYYVLASRAVGLAKGKMPAEYLTLSAILPMLLFFSLSKFQLNFYTNILFPFFSLLVAFFIYTLPAGKKAVFYSTSQAVYSTGFIIAGLVVNFYFRPPQQWVYYAGSLLLILSVLLILKKQASVGLRWLLVSCLCVLYFNFYLNLTVYPRMAALKGEHQAADYVNRFYAGKRLGVFENRRNGFEFYSHQPVQRIDMDDWLAGREQDRIFYIDDPLFSQLSAKAARFDILQEFPDYNSESLSGKFINSATRESSLHRGYLIRASGQF